MTTAALLLLGLAALLPIVFGVRYLLTKEFMPYHAVVAGKAWTELDGGVQTIVLGMLRIVGGGLISYGLATLWLLLPLSRGEPWAIWAILTTSAASIGSTLFVTVWLRKVQPKANTPIAPTAVCLALVLAGVGAALLQ
jgi:uncharacterized protein YjeT (DUF2065 family)